MHGRSIFLPPKARLGKVLVELLDDHRLASSQRSSALSFGIFSVVSTNSGDLVDGYPEFQTNRKNTTGWLDVSAAPILVVNTGSSDDEVIDGRAGVGLLHNHDMSSEQEPVEWHGLRVAFVLRPITSRVRPYAIRSAEIRPSNKANVAVLANRSVGPENWVMGVLIKVMPTSTAMGLLKDVKED